MTRIKKIFRNIIIIFSLLLLLILKLNLYSNPISAHKASEKTIHYGPSEIVHIQDFDNTKYVLTRYDNWFSCNTIDKKLGFLWQPSGDPRGDEINKAEPISYRWTISYLNYKVYGIVNDTDIKEVHIITHKGERLVQNTLYDNMFLLVGTIPTYDVIRYIEGYDKDGNLIYSEPH